MMKPAESITPIQACGSLCSSARRERDRETVRRMSDSLGVVGRAGSKSLGSETGSVIGVAYELALYNVSTPSGIMIIKHVPTSRPVPMADMIREWFEERPKDSGREPARKDLKIHLVS